MFNSNFMKSEIESPEIDPIFCRSQRSQSMQSVLTPAFKGMTIINDHIPYKAQKKVELINEEEEFNQTEPLQTSFFKKLLAMEDMIINHTYTLDILLELVKYYTRAIEYYDYMQDTIQCYFLEKMQSTLSKIESLKLLIPKKEDDAFAFDGEPLTPNKQEQNTEQNETYEQKAKKREKIKRMNFKQRQTSYAQTHSNKMLDYDLNQKRIERAKKLKIFMEATENQTETDFDLISGKYFTTVYLRDEIINSNIQKQNQEFKNRLENNFAIYASPYNQIYMKSTMSAQINQKLKFAQDQTNLSDKKFVLT